MSRQMAGTWMGVAAAISLVAGSALAAGPLKKGPLKVFILAGDSNCEGKAAITLLDPLISEPETAPTYKHLKAADGKWAERDDVWMSYLGRKGKLSVGYGGGTNQFGIELQIGNVLGDKLDNQVLLIKTAWGGSGVTPSMGLSFCSPSSGTNGTCYTKMIDSVKTTIKDLKTLFPDYDEAKGYEIAGFVWFSGWNDGKAANYEDCLANLIKDVRKELNVPNMPVVIGEMGVCGPDQPGKEISPVRKSQRAVAARPEFKGTVKYVKTGEYFDMKSWGMFKDGSWKGANNKEFYKWCSDRPYHYMGSAKTFFMMGDVIGKGMVEVLK